jgi:hypothetical protein
VGSDGQLAQTKAELAEPSGALASRVNRSVD